MKILAFTDTHSMEHAEDKILEKAWKHKPDFLLCAGDFTMFMRDALAFFKKISSLKIKTYLVHGNHEDEFEIAKLSKKFPHVQFIHEKHVVHDDFLIMGYGGGGFSYRDERFEKISKNFKKAIDSCKQCKKILLLHQPPHGTGIDLVYGENAGNKSTRQFVEKHNIDIVLAGHLHENSGKQIKIKSTYYINPGPLGKILEFKKKK
jgi:Icc-related predicted phosphoesterase